MPCGETMGTLEWLPLLLKGKYWILSSVFVAAIVGVIIANTIPKSYEAVVITRPTDPAVLAELSELLSGNPGDWHSTTNVVATAQQVFLRYARNRNDFVTYMHSYEDPVSKAKMYGLGSLNVVVLRDAAIQPNNKNDDAIEFHLRHSDRTSGPQV